MRALALLVLVLPLTVSHTAELVWVTTDFTSGGLATMAARECVAREISLPIPGDAVVRAWGRYVFVIGRFGYDHITVLDAADPGQVLAQYSTGNGSNPQDVLVVNETKALVTLLERSYALVVNPLTGDSLGIVPLGLFADQDGTPEAARAFSCGGVGYVVCQRLDRSTPSMEPSGPACLAMVDLSSLQLVDADPSTPGIDPIWLPLANPAAVASGLGEWYLACTGSWGSTADGGVVAFRPHDGSCRVVATEAVFGGNVACVAVWQGKGFVAVALPDWTNQVVPCQLSSGQVGTPLPSSGGYIPDLVVHEGILYVADQGTWLEPARAGVLVFDAATDALLCGPVQTGLPPFSGAMVGPTAGEPTEVPFAVRVAPNPASTWLAVSLPPTRGDLCLGLFDAAGRCLVAQHVAGGTSTQVLPTSGLPPGVYFLRVQGSGSTCTLPVVVR